MQSAEKGLDENVLDTILRPHYPNLTILSIAKSQNPFLRVQEAIAERNFQLLIKVLNNALEKSDAHTPIALPLSFDTPTARPYYITPSTRYKPVGRMATSKQWLITFCPCFDY